MYNPSEMADTEISATKATLTNRVLLAIPRYSRSVDYGSAVIGLTQASMGKSQVKICSPHGSFLTLSFNSAWCLAYNYWKDSEIEWFAMQHADIEPERGWVDKLIGIAEDRGADVVSTVSPIKDNRGLTSTAVEGLDPWYPKKRLTMKEVMALPPTFSQEDVGGPLLVNTGLWVCRMGKWCREICFTVYNRIVEDERGYLKPEAISEDWDFGRQLNKLGRKVFATREVALDHWGEHAVGNQTAWGDWDTDKESTNHL